MATKNKHGRVGVKRPQRHTRLTMAERAEEFRKGWEAGNKADRLRTNELLGRLLRISKAKEIHKEVEAFLASQN